MSIISSHILDAVHGCSASGIRVMFHSILNNQEFKLVFDVNANEEGRIMEEFVFPESGDTSF